MPKRLEHSIEDYVVRIAERHGIQSIKLNLPRTAGWPDRLFLFPGGHAVWLELKRDGKSPDDLQRHRIQELRRLGFQAGWTDNSSEAIEWLMQMKKIYE